MANQIFDRAEWARGTPSAQPLDAYSTLQADAGVLLSARTAVVGAALVGVVAGEWLQVVTLVDPLVVLPFAGVFPALVGDVRGAS